MRRDRIRGLQSAVDYITQFNPHMKGIGDVNTYVEDLILKSAESLDKKSTEIMTAGFLVKFEDPSDPNGDIEVWVNPQLWWRR